MICIVFCNPILPLLVLVTFYTMQELFDVAKLKCFSNIVHVFYCSNDSAFFYVFVVCVFGYTALVFVLVPFYFLDKLCFRLVILR